MGEGGYFDFSGIGGRRLIFPQPCDRRRSQRRACRQRRGRLCTPSDSACRGISTARAILRAQAERVGQDLEDDVPLRRSKPVMPQRRETESVSRAVREVKPALQGVRLVLCVFQPRQTRANKTVELLRVRSFLPEDVAGTGQALKRRRGGHVPIQSPRVSAARAPASRTRFPSGRALKTRRPCTPWVDFSTHGARNPLKGAEDVAIREAVADDHQVDVACRLVGRLGHRTVHEGRTNRLRQGLQGTVQRLREADGLQHDIPQLGIQW